MEDYQRVGKIPVKEIQVDQYFLKERLFKQELSPLAMDVPEQVYPVSILE